MFPRVFLLETLHSRLISLKKPTKGALYGIFYEKSVLLVGLAILDEGEDALFPSGLSAQTHFPTGIDFCGAFAVSDDSNMPAYVKHIIKDVMVTDNPVYLRKSRYVDEVIGFVIINEVATEITFSTMSEAQFSELFVTLYVPTTLSVSCDDYRPALFSNIDELLNEVGNGLIFFEIDGTDESIIPEGCGNPIDEPNYDLTISQIYKNATKMYFNHSKQVTLLVSMHFPGHGGAVKYNELCSYIQHVKESMDVFQYELPIHALCVTTKNRRVRDCYGLFIDTICRSLLLYKFEMERRTDIHSLQNILQYNYYPPSLGHFVSAVFNSDDSQYDRRKKFHNALALPLEWPLFKSSNSITFKEFVQKSPIFNIHESIPGTETPDCETYLVRGHYEYYHYKVDGANDDGWGCAYRSLQTIFSWFREQGFTSRKVPSISEIQSILVKIGDKPTDFMGSKCWIGSTEVSYVLQDCLDVSCKILSVPVGSNLDTIAEELAAHFQVHSTPVMIGGGVLAHTIIGVQIEKKSKTTKYLVLDPHYVGPDDVKTILSKGWVSWKPKSFWNSNSFYNLCLPLRARTF